jgi:N-ATPase, AtpR subunit
MNGGIVTIAAFLAVGIAVGAVHAGLLCRAVMLLTGAATERTTATIALNLARFGFVIAAFWFVAQAGAAALIAAVAGFTLAVIGARFFVERA